MATISPTQDNPDQNILRFVWSGISTGDTITEAVPPREFPLLASVEISGTFGGATVDMQVSNSGSTYFTLTDTNGQKISTTSAMLVDFSSAGYKFKPSITGGTGDSVTVTLIMRTSG